MKASIAADRLITGIIVPAAGGSLNPSISFQNTKKDVFIVTEQERYLISADFEFIPKCSRKFGPRISQISIGFQFRL